MAVWSAFLGEGGHTRDLKIWLLFFAMTPSGWRLPLFRKTKWEVNKKLTGSNWFLKKGSNRNWSFFPKIFFDLRCRLSDIDQNCNWMELKKKWSEIFKIEIFLGFVNERILVHSRCTNLILLVTVYFRLWACSSVLKSKLATNTKKK